MASANSKTSSDLFTRAEKSFPKKNVHLIYAHGIMACVAWVILIPFGAILIKIVPGRYAFWVHTIFQVAGLLAFWGAAAIGVWLSVTLHKIDSHHAKLGLVIFVLSFIQPILGLIYHGSFQRRKRNGNDTTRNASTTSILRLDTGSPPSTGSSPVEKSTSFSSTPQSRGIRSLPKITRVTTFSSLLHRYLGRILITLSAINGGLGLRLQNRASQAERYAYAAVVAGIFGIYWGVVLGMNVANGRIRQERGEKEDKRAVRAECDGMEAT